jgi:transposase
MAPSACIARLGGWVGYGVQEHCLEDRAGVRWCVIRLQLEPDRPRCCGGCGAWVAAIHDVVERRVRDLPIFEHLVELIVPRVRVACPACGPRLERLPWLDRWARVTTRLATNVARLCSVMTIRHVANFYALDWKTVKAIDFRHLEHELGPIDLAGVEVIGMDEFAIQKGHRYATVIVEPRRKGVLWLGRGRARADIRPFFQLLAPEGRARIKAVVIDMNAGYAEEVRAQCPKAQIVYDLFHVVAKYAREVIDRVRVDEANRLRADKQARQVVKHSRWLLLRNRENVPAADQVRLDELLAAKRPLFIAYVLKDDLKALWDYRHTGYAMRFWRQWYRRAMRSGIEPLRRFARNLKPYLRGILAQCQWPLGTNPIEGINNKIKLIKRMAHGYRDDAYFFLKIRAAFPGNGR